MNYSSNVELLGGHHKKRVSCIIECVNSEPGDTLGIPEMGSGPVFFS